MKTNVGGEYRANQTESHQKLVEAAYIWLLNRAYRGVRGTSEFSASDGYSADLVAITSLFGQKYNERYLPVELHHSRVVCVFEAKITRSDFLKHFGEGRDNARTKAPMGHLHWILAPAGLLDTSEIPKWWGLLEQRGNGGLVEVKKPQYCVMTKAQVDSIGHDMLWVEGSQMRELECTRIMKIVGAMRSLQNSE